MTNNFRDDFCVQETNKLSDFLAKVGFNDIPKNVIERAKLTIADTFAVALKGSEEPEMENLYKKIPLDDEANILKAGFPKTNIAMAGFLNTTSACFVELDEGTSPSGHPALHILPAALAASQKYKKSGKDLITSFVLGYEVQNRLQKAMTIRPEMYPHGNTGHVGATVSVGKLLSWNNEKFREGINCSAALPLATSHASSLTGYSITTVFASMSPSIAFIVADLVESGFTGFDSALSDTFGTIIGNKFNSEELTLNLGKEYGISKNYFKFHANCALTHPAIEAAADALGFSIQHDVFPPYKYGRLLKPEEIKSIEIVQGNKSAQRVMNISHNKISAKFSIPYSLSVFLLTGDASADMYGEKYINDKNINSLEKLITLNIDDSLSGNLWGAKIIINLNNGQVLTGESKNIYGRQENPANEKDIYNKFSGLTDNLLCESKKNELWNKIMNLDKVEDVNELFI